MGEMALDPAKRKIFVDSCVHMLDRFDFDGLDFDWEYPGSRPGSDPEHDKEDFTLLIQEMGEALHSRGKMLTAALNADPVKSGEAYNVPAISQVLDLLHIMDYDYHGAGKSSQVITALYSDEGKRTKLSIQGTTSTSMTPSPGGSPREPRLRS